jgi:predicted unusual protein kinase regulating ubiquinone biosynthesis (AarF/ABC1/UbiB family)
MYKNRYRRILWFFGRIILSVIWWDVILARIGLRWIARRNRNDRFRRIAANYRQVAVQMGGVMIKVGQFLSSRLDVLPRSITDELAGLQDEVRPEEFPVVIKVAEAEFASTIQTKFESVDPIPLAAASIGQVHRAILAQDSVEPGCTLREVVIKVQRPDIEKIVEVDLSALKIVAGWLMRYPPIRKRANIPALLDEFSRSLYEELDYLNEASNAELFAANFAGHPEIQVPEVVRSHSTGRVITLEYIEAIKITDYPAIEAAGVDRSEVAKRLFDAYLKQIFDDKFFHADPHPGNLFVLPLEEEKSPGIPRKWKLVFIDFGMMGTISDKLLKDLREILIAVGTKDGARIVRTYTSMGVLLPGADLEMLEKATNRVFERFWGKTAPEMMNMHQEEAVEFVREFGDLIFSMPFQVPENLILFARGLGILSGMCTGLDRGFNVWTNIGPYAQKLVSDEGLGGWRFWLGEIGSMVTLMASLPRKTDALLSKIEQGKMQVHMPETDRRIAKLETSIKGFSTVLIFIAFMVTSTQFYRAKEQFIAGILAVGAVISLGIVIIRR